MVQKEVGERLIAKAGNGDYGAISAVLDFYGNVKILRQVPRRMFVPSPNVDSCIVEIEFVNNKYNADNRLIESVVKSAFSNRRKTLVNNIMMAFKADRKTAEDMVVKVKGDVMARGETLTTEDFVTLSKLITENNLKF